MPAYANIPPKKSVWNSTSDKRCIAKCFWFFLVQQTTSSVIAEISLNNFFCYGENFMSIQFHLNFHVFQYKKDSKKPWKNDRYYEFSAYILCYRFLWAYFFHFAIIIEIIIPLCFAINFMLHLSQNSAECCCFCFCHRNALNHTLQVSRVNDELQLT